MPVHSHQLFLLDDARRAWQSAVDRWMIAVRFWERRLKQRILKAWVRSLHLELHDQNLSHFIHLRRLKSKAFDRLSQNVRIQRALRDWPERRGKVYLKRWRRRINGDGIITSPLQILAAFRWIALTAPKPRRYYWRIKDALSSREMKAMNADMPNVLQGMVRKAGIEGDAGMQEALRLVQERKGLRHLEGRIREYLLGAFQLPPQKLPVLLQAHAILDAWMLARKFGCL